MNIKNEMIATNEDQSASKIIERVSAPRKLDKERYYKIAEKSGINAALTALHNEMWELEFECFEGQEGYNAELYEDLKKFREFAVELWDKKLTQF